MPLRNTRATWGVVHKFLHWTIALAVIALATVGWFMDDMPSSPDKIRVYALHKSAGLTVLALVVLRLAWRWSQPRPQSPPTMRPWERRLAGAVHFGLYAVLIGMPLSGWIYNSASGFPLKWFGLFRLPALVGRDRELAFLVQDAHFLFALTWAGLFMLHVAGALKHHFMDRDDVLVRMLPSARSGRRDPATPPEQLP